MSSNYLFLRLYTGLELKEALKKKALLEKEGYEVKLEKQKLTISERKRIMKEPGYDVLGRFIDKSFFS